ncbi:MAG TPA: hypothetical protein VKB71_06075, partial [Rhizomicrobium sp.]|nr:hypothetical protein [Rhizomicrobium sp.]
GALRRWWPTTQSIDLVEGSVAAVAEAVLAEFTRFSSGQQISAEWVRFRDFDEACGSAPGFSNVVTFALVLPTRSRWCAIWNNSFLCSGYDSLCWRLTSHHKLTTLHWSAHDGWTTFQSGTSFTFRRNCDGSLVERSVAAIQEDSKWVFHAVGPALEEEDLSVYARKRKRDRLNESEMMSLLGRLGAYPWAEEFYALPEQECFVISRHLPATAAPLRSREEVIRPPAAG